MRVIKTASATVTCRVCKQPFEVVRFRARTQKFCSKKCEGDSRYIPPEKRLRYTIDENGCWLWSGCVDVGGYAVFSVRRKTKKVHIFTYTQKNGPVPVGLQLDHLCRVRRCINPDHLEVVTNAVNSARGARWGSPIVCSEIRAAETMR